MSKLRELRMSAGLTQRALANRAVVARASISHVEIGKYTPSAKFADKICKALGGFLGCELKPWDVFPDDFEEVKQ